MSFRKATLFIFVFCVQVFCSHATDSFDTNYYEQRIRMILDDLVEITSRGDKNDVVHEAVLTTLEQLQQKKASKYLDPDEKGILSGMKFTFQRDNAEFGLSFGPVFLDTYTEKSSTHLAVLIHEMWHLRDFVKQHESFYNASAGSREKLWFELDAFHVEAIFVKDYLQDARQLSRFDAFLLESFQKDNLDSVLLFMHKRSADIFFQFQEIDSSFNKGQESGVALIDKIARLGRQMIDAYKTLDSTSEFSRYVAYIEILSFRNEMLKSLPLLLQSPSMTWDQVFEKFPEVGKVYRESVELEKSDHESHTGYLERVVDWWENDIRMSS